MLSLICCSQYEDIPKELSFNVQKTIGVEYEWIWIYNQNNKYSIFEAYNIGVQKAQGKILCFMHQDIEYLSNNWGKLVENLLSRNDVDACAVAGADYYRKSPSYYPCGKGHNKINLIQYTVDGDIHWEEYNKSERIVVFDGLWFCIKKTCFDKIRFDSTLYSGFHFYDIDIAVQMYVNRMNVYTIPDVWIKHYSSGNTNLLWLRNSFLFYEKWKNIMPINVNPVDQTEVLLLEKEALYSAFRSTIHFHELKLMIKCIKIAGEVLERNPMVALFSVLKSHYKKHNRIGTK